MFCRFIFVFIFIIFIYFPCVRQLTVLELGLSLYFFLFFLCELLRKQGKTMYFKSHINTFRQCLLNNSILINFVRGFITSIYLYTYLIIMPSGVVFNLEFLCTELKVKKGSQAYH